MSFSSVRKAESPVVALQDQPVETRKEKEKRPRKPGALRRLLPKNWFAEFRNIDIRLEEEDTHGGYRGLGNAGILLLILCLSVGLEQMNCARWQMLFHV